MKRKWRGYLWQTLPVLGIAFAMLVILTPVSISAREQARGKFTQEIELYLDNGYAAFLSDLEYLDAVLYNLRYNKHIMALSQADDQQLAESGYRDLFLYQETLDKMGTLNIRNAVVLLQFQRNSLFIRPLSGRYHYSNKADYYGNLYYYEGLPYDEWQNRLFSGRNRIWPSAPIYLTGMGMCDYLTINTFCYNISTIQSVFSVLIPTDTLVSTFLPENMRGHGFVYVTDGDGALLFAHNYDGGPLENPYANSARIGAAEHLLFTAQNQEDGLKVVAGVPEGAVRAASSSASVQINLCIGVAVIFAVIYAILYAYWHFRPLNELAESLDTGAPDLGGRNIYKRLHLAFINANASLREFRKSYQAVNRQMYTMALLHAIRGGHLEEEEKRVLSKSHLLSDAYCLVCIEPEHSVPEAWQLLCVKLQLLLQEAYEDCESFIADSLIAVIPSDPIHIQSFTALIGGLVETGNEILFAGISMPHRGVDSLYSAAYEMRFAINEARRNGSPRVVCYQGGEIKRTNTSLQTYLDLSEGIAGGNRDMVDEIFVKIRA